MERSQRKAWCFLYENLVSWYTLHPNKNEYISLDFRKTIVSLRQVSGHGSNGRHEWICVLQGWTVINPSCVPLISVEQTSFSSQWCDHQHQMGFAQLHFDAPPHGCCATGCSCHALGFSNVAAWNTYKIPLRTQKCRWIKALINFSLFHAPGR